MTLQAHFINVGQGDAILVRYQDGVARWNMLVDGGRADQGNKVVRYLREAGVRGLDLVVATHVDDDHIGGLPAVLDAFPPRHFWGPDPRQARLALTLFAATEMESRTPGEISVTSFQSYLQLHAQAVQCGAIVAYPAAGFLTAYATPAGLNIRVLGPAAGEPRALLETLAPEMEHLSAEERVGILSTATNNASIILWVDAGGPALLLPGDAEEKGWERANAEEGALRAEVLKVSHHGGLSGTPRWVPTAVQPRTSVISVGPNAYGHPHPMVIGWLQEYGSVLRTDEAGDIRWPEEGRRPSLWERLLAWLRSHLGVGAVSRRR